jgi:dinuclear metal center YbgI/SA1388 family protein
MKISDITSYLETIAPLSYQESYDNSGLLTGSSDQELRQALITLDCTEEIVEEAIKKNCNLIIAHHPIIFSGLKKLNGKNYIERTVIKAIKNDIAIYAIHTNLDNVHKGVNAKICEKIGLVKNKILSPKTGLLKKLITFCPTEHADKVRNALFEAGAGHIGNYDSCSYNSNGIGSFRGLEDSKPFVGEAKKLHFEPEVKIETIFPSHLQKTLIKALLASHPYEEVACDIIPLDNKYAKVGSGMIGELPTPMSEALFLQHIKKQLNTSLIRFTRFLNKEVKKVAVCGGSGSFLLHEAIAQKADVFITADFKYHQFFDADKRIIIADVGHYESEQFTKDLIFEIIKEKFPNFALHLSEINTNPINYLS